MTFEECKNILQNFDGITLYSIKLEYFNSSFGQQDVIGILLFGSSLLIFAISQHCVICHNAIHCVFTQFIQCKDLSKVEFIKCIVNIIREYKNDN